MGGGGLGEGAFGGDVDGERAVGDGGEEVGGGGVQPGARGGVMEEGGALQAEGASGEVADAEVVGGT